MRLEEAGSAQDLGNVKRKLKAWRSKFGGPGRKLPEFLWAEVVPVAKRRGVNEVARALRLRIESVEARVRVEAGESSKALGKAEAPAFLELGALPFSPGITIEVEGCQWLSETA